MRKLFFLLILVVAGSTLYAQQEDVESTIRALEQKEVVAVLNKDTTALKQIWSSDFTVNSPLNNIQSGGKSTLDRPVIMGPGYLKFERNIEQILIRGDIVIAMGNELVVRKDKDGKEGETFKRRYTNIWMRQGSNWQLTARHANKICQ